MRRALAGLAILTIMAGGGAWLLHASIDQSEDAGQLAVTTRHELLGSLKSWGYQLQNVDVASAARSPHDLLVVDEDFLSSSNPSRRQEALRQLKQKPGGRRRLVLAYLSIGEAESYRGYWNKAWVAPTMPGPPPGPVETATIPARAEPGAREPRTFAAPQVFARTQEARPVRAPTVAAPAWLGVENPEWRGNYHVRYWDEAWQRLMLGSETSALERIIAAGFDGVYLDRADAYQYWQKERPGAKGDMSSLIEQISDRARAISPGFIIIMQNAEELLGQNRLRSAIDAIAKEDLLHGIDGTEAPNAERDVTESIRYLKKAQSSGLPVLVVEYLSEAHRIETARKRIEGLGFVPYFAPRALDRLTSLN